MRLVAINRVVNQVDGQGVVRRVPESRQRTGGGGWGGRIYARVTLRPCTSCLKAPYMGGGGGGGHAHFAQLFMSC